MSDRLMTYDGSGREMGSMTIDDARSEYPWARIETNDLGQRTITVSRGWTVYHGGQHHGLGRWSGPHATRREAEDSARQCRQVVGGDPTIELD